MRWGLRSVSSGSVMAQHPGPIMVECRLAWWLKPYLFTLVCLCYLMGAEPDWQRVQAWIQRGVLLRCPPKEREWQRGSALRYVPTSPAGPT